MFSKSACFLIVSFSLFVVTVFFSGCFGVSASPIGESSPIQVSQFNQLNADVNFVGLTDGYGVLNYYALSDLNFDFVTPTVIADDTNWQTGWSVFDANMRSYYSLKGDVNTWGDQRYTPLGRKLGINGTIYDLSADRNWTIATSSDSNWQTSWSVFDANVKSTYGLSPVSGRIPFSDGTKFSSDGNLFWDNTNKRLGIGTASPAYLIDARRSGDGVVATFTSETGANREGLYITTNVSTSPYLTTLASSGSYTGALALATGVSEIMRLVSGKVGIGTTAPTALLHVSDVNGLTSPAFRVDANSLNSSAVMTMLPSGNVGIGTASPA
jgi:hypothetical protein